MRGALISLGGLIFRDGRANPGTGTPMFVVGLGRILAGSAGLSVARHADALWVI